MAIDVYMYFNGNCREAVAFYADVFKTEKQSIMTYGEAPPDPKRPLSKETKNLVLHTVLTINGSNVMFSDCPPDIPYIVGNNISVVLSYTDKNEMKAHFMKLKEGGGVHMDLQETFFSKYFGYLTDKFGMMWQLIYVS